MEMSPNGPQPGLCIAVLCKGTTFQGPMGSGADQITKAVMDGIKGLLDGLKGGGGGGGGGGQGQEGFTPATPTAPTCTISATPLNSSGTSVALTWRTTAGTEGAAGAVTAYISPAPGSVQSSGAITVDQVPGTTYLMTVTGAGGTGTCQTGAAGDPTSGLLTNTGDLGATGGGRGSGTCDALSQLIGACSPANPASLTGGAGATNAGGNAGNGTAPAGGATGTGTGSTNCDVFSQILGLCNKSGGTGANTNPGANTGTKATNAGNTTNTGNTNTGGAGTGVTTAGSGRTGVGEGVTVGSTDTGGGSTPPVSAADSPGMRLGQILNPFSSGAQNAEIRPEAPTPLQVSSSIVNGGAIRLPDGRVGTIVVTDKGVTIVASVRADTGDSAVAGFFGRSGKGGLSLGARICASRPWSSGFISKIIPPSFFDGICSAVGNKAGVTAAHTDRETTTPRSTERIVISQVNLPQASTTDPDTLNPQVNIWAQPPTVRLGARTNIYWTSTDVKTCAVTGPSFSEGALLGGAATVPLSEDSLFTIRCVTAGGKMVTKSVRVSIK